MIIIGERPSRTQRGLHAVCADTPATLSTSIALLRPRMAALRRRLVFQSIATTNSVTLKFSGPPEHGGPGLKGKGTTPAPTSADELNEDSGEDGPWRGRGRGL